MSVLFETGELNAYVYDGGGLYRRKYVRTESKGSILRSLRVLLPVPPSKSWVLGKKKAIIRVLQFFPVSNIFLRNVSFVRNRRIACIRLRWWWALPTEIRLGQGQGRTTTITLADGKLLPSIATRV